MKLILNKNKIEMDNIILINKPNGYKILYKLNNVYMNGIHIKISSFNFVIIAKIPQAEIISPKI